MLLYTARLVGKRAIAVGLFLLASRGVMGTQALVWFVTYFASVVSAVWLYRTSADTLERRANIAATGCHACARAVWLRGLSCTRALAPRAPAFLRVGKRAGSATERVVQP